MGKKKSRANGEGSIYQLGDGRWRAVITTGWTLDGKRRRRTRTAKLRSDAAAFLREMQNEADSGIVEPSTVTVGKFLERWLQDFVKPNLAPNTFVSYSRTCNNHIIPRLGKTKLKKLVPMHIQRFTAAMLDDGVGSCTRRYAYRTLNNALNYAKKNGMLSTNPCDIADAPRHKRDDIYPFTLEEMNTILRDVEESCYEVLFALAFTTGMRPSEIYGLHWKDVDFDSGTLFVHQQLCRAARHKAEFRPPKTESSIRTLHMPERLIGTLHDRRKIQMQEGIGKCPLVISSHKGTPIHNAVVYRNHWIPVLKRLKIEHRGLHHMRHTYATLQLRAGVPVHIVSAVLGHSKPSQTWDTYSHLMAGDEKTAATSIQEMIG